MPVRKPLTDNKQTILLFDAVGTLIRPVQDAVSVYHSAARRFGSQLQPPAISQRFEAARQRLFQTDLKAADCPPGSLVSSDSHEYQLWKQTVSDVLNDIEPNNEAFEFLWNYFAAPEHWEIFPDVEPCWRQLGASGITIGLASNFDSRLVEIVRHHALLATCDHLFYSARIGYLKPDPNFYREVGFHFDADSRIVMVGDNLQNDCEGPRLAGWQAFWLDRADHHQSDTTYRIRNLLELPQLLAND